MGWLYVALSEEDYSSITAFFLYRRVSEKTREKNKIPIDTVGKKEYSMT